MSPTIHLKPQHLHTKITKPQSLSQHQSSSSQSNHLIQLNLNSNNNNIPFSQGNHNPFGGNKIQTYDHKNKQPPKPQNQINKIKSLNPSKPQKQPLPHNLNQKNLQKPNNNNNTQEKSLTVQLVKKLPQASNSIDKQKSITSQLQQKPDKKNKKKKKKALPFPQDTSPQQRLNFQTQQLFSQSLQRHKIPFNYQYPQLMSLLKQSYKPFALNQVVQDKRLIEMGQDPTQTMNTSKQYNIALFDQLNKRKNFHQQRIYLGVLEENQLFNDLIWRQQIQSQSKKQQVALLFGDIHLLVMNDVWQGQYEIKPKQKASKDQIIYGSYKANQIRMAESIIKQKLTNLNDQLIVDVEGQESSQFMNHKKFDLNSQQTKKAQEFVKKLQQEDKSAKQRAKRAKQLQEQEQIKRLQQQQQNKRRQQQQRLQQRRIKLLQKAQERQKQKKYREEQQRQYQEYLSQHRSKTPLFKKKQEDFKAFIIKEQIRKFQQLRELQKNKRSVSKEQLEIHQMKYKELKQLLEEERLQLLRLQQEEADDKYVSFYKGKYHNSIMSERDRKTTMEMKKDQASQLYAKKLQYATAVKSKFIPKIDPKKKQQLQILINDLKPKVYDDKLVAQKTKMQGYRNLQKLHQIMAEMKAKGKLKKAQTPQVNTSFSKPNSSRYINYLNDMRTSRMKNSISTHNNKSNRFNSLDISKLSNISTNRQSLNHIEFQARNLQEHADRRSLFLKNSKNLDMEDYLQRKFAVQDDYIESAKVKMQVLNKYKMVD